MKSSELRIGNWVDFDGESDKITAYQLYVNFMDDDCGIEPIPITEEWLVKFGFEKWHDGSCYIKKYSNQGELLVFNHTTPVAAANDIKPGEYYYIFHRTVHVIKYVHQLQNLYFALTGTELTLTTS